MFKKIAIFLLLLLIVGGIVFMMGPRVPINQELRPHQVPGNPDQLEVYLSKQESRFKDIRPNTQKQITWAGPQKVQTPLSVVYLHGWSASRKETAPLSNQLAKELGANFFATRLTGHGRPGEALAQATVNDWLNDAMEALAIGKVLGKRVIIVGTSTGGTLATWLATRIESKEVLAYIMLSPNFGPKDERSKILLWPWGAHIARTLVGKRRSWKPANPEQNKYWTTSYPIEALLPMMGLVKMIDEVNLRDFRTPVLVMYSPKDEVINPNNIVKRFPHIAATTKQLIAVKVRDKSHHVFAGAILGPNNTKAILKHITTFLQPLLPKAQPAPTTPAAPTNPTNPANPAQPDPSKAQPTPSKPAKSHP